MAKEPVRRSASATRKNHGLRALAEKCGYEPCEFAMRRLAEQAAIIDTWKGEIDVGKVPGDLSTLSLAEASEIYRRERSAMIEEERKWAKFFYAELRATELTGADGEDLFRDLSDTERAARIAAILDAGRARRTDDLDNGGEDVVTPAGPADPGTAD